MDKSTYKKPSVSFILAAPSPIPIGGLRIIYEYANRLSQRGWQVNVVHPARLVPDAKNPFILLLFWAAFYKNMILGLFLPKKWFPINRRIKMLWVPNLNERYIPDADFIIACPVETAFFVNSYRNKKGKKYYFIQHFEDWTIPPQEVEKSWKLPLKKIVIAKWLQEIAVRLGESAIYIPNGLDFSFFKVIIPFHDRPMKSILFLSHYLDIKGTKYALDAVLKIKERYPETVISSFGIDKKPNSFPAFINYYQNPSQEKLRLLYNQSQLFISPSLAEGWPLPPAEAMLCGCLVIATDIGGHNEYIVHSGNGLLCKPQSSESIAEKIVWTFNNPEKTVNLAKQAPQSLIKYDWDSRVDLFEKALCSN
jgi:glycosyltransferase involved in cell wall biosynthesis